MRKEKTRIRVRYEETDQMGVAYYANYLIWFEVGRTELMRVIGLPYREFEKSGLYFPVLKAYCEYKHPAGYDDELVIITSLEKMRGVRITFKYEVCCDNRLLARGYTEHAFINEKGRPVALSRYSPPLWKRLCRSLDNKSNQSEGFDGKLD